MLRSQSGTVVRTANVSPRQKGALGRRAPQCTSARNSLLESRIFPFLIKAAVEIGDILVTMARVMKPEVYKKKGWIRDRDCSQTV